MAVPLLAVAPDPYIKGFEAYLQLEKSLSANSIDAYLRDVDKLYQFLAFGADNPSPLRANLKDLRAFLLWLQEFEIAPALKPES
ncbi:site-specific integrase [bacterium SCSIO 12741]|nr:site-specific integrase [bacterium SCSIO 12741]